MGGLKGGLCSSCRPLKMTVKKLSVKLKEERAAAMQAVACERKKRYALEDSVVTRLVKSGEYQLLGRDVSVIPNGVAAARVEAAECAASSLRTKLDSVKSKLSEERAAHRVLLREERRATAGAVMKNLEVVESLWSANRKAKLGRKAAAQLQVLKEKSVLAHRRLASSEAKVKRSARAMKTERQKNRRHHAKQRRRLRLPGSKKQRGIKKKGQLLVSWRRMKVTSSAYLRGSTFWRG